METVGGARDTVVDGHVVRVVPLGLACCAVEVAAGLPLLPPADGSAVTAIMAAAGDRNTPDAPDAPPDTPHAPDTPGIAPSAHVLVIAGTVTPAVVPDVRAAWEELPEPRAAVAYGVCTISGGPYWDSYAVVPGLAADPGLDSILPGYIAVSGCPPPPSVLESAVVEAARSALGSAGGAGGAGGAGDGDAEERGA